MRWAAAAIVAFTLLGGCTVAGGAAAQPTSVELVVFAAASLAGPLERLEPAFEAAHPRVSLVISTDSSAALRTQIEQGAGAAVFLSADTANPQRLADAGMAVGEPVSFAGNVLTIVTPPDDPGDVEDPADLARAGVRVIAAGEEVPITRYAREVVEKLGIAPGYAANVVSREDNVQAVLAKVGLGEGDAAIVYRTDAMASEKVRVIEIPAEANVAATYAGAVVAGSGREAEARAFLDWLTGPEGQALLGEFGFTAAP